MDIGNGSATPARAAEARAKSLMIKSLCEVARREMQAARAERLRRSGQPARRGAS
jgi:hypothetical protein